MTAAKAWIKKLFIKIAFSGRKKIVIASTGRAGSTMLHTAIANNLIRERFHVDPEGLFGRIIKWLCTGYVERIRALPHAPCFICKTHDTYESMPSSMARYVFVYGDPLESAMSVEQVVNKEGVKWFKLHQFHLKAVGEYSDLYKEDVLNYRGQIESWLNHHGDDVLCVDYDDLWEEQGRLADFLGIDITLPAKRPRQRKSEQSNVNQNLFQHLREKKEVLKRKLR